MGEGLVCGAALLDPHTRHHVLTALLVGSALDTACDMYSCQVGAVCRLDRSQEAPAVEVRVLWHKHGPSPAHGT